MRGMLITTGGRGTGRGTLVDEDVRPTLVPVVPWLPLGLGPFPEGRGVLGVPEGVRGAFPEEGRGPLLDDEVRGALPDEGVAGRGPLLDDGVRGAGPLLRLTVLDPPLLVFELPDVLVLELEFPLLEFPLLVELPELVFLLLLLVLEFVFPLLVLDPELVLVF